jgi:hypothetical protein
MKIDVALVPCPNHACLVGSARQQQHRRFITTLAKSLYELDSTDAFEAIIGYDQREGSDR